MFSKEVVVYLVGTHWNCFNEIVRIFHEYEMQTEKFIPRITDGIMRFAE